MNKNTKIVAALIALGLVSPMAYATNGAVMMAVGSQNTALGGSGVANFTGADSVFANPAMLGKSKASEVTGGIVLFKPTVTNDGMDGAAATSDAKTSYIPDVSYSNRISDSLTYGIAMAGIAGMGVDYTAANANTHIRAKTAYTVLHIVPTIAYNQKDYGVGFSPVMQYGTLMISYNNPAGAARNTAEKVDTVTAFGFSMGGYYNVTPAITVAASYESEIAAKYGTQLSDAGTGFGLTGAEGTALAAFGDDLNQPAQMKAGVAYAMNDALTVTADYKIIQYGSAKGWKDFNWKDQAVIAVGGKYAANGYWLGLGYNHADDPIAVLGAGQRNSTVNFFNNMMFPGVVKSSYTFGGGYAVSSALDIDAAVVITPEVTKSVDVSGLGLATPNVTTHSQQSMSVSLRYKF